MKIKWIKSKFALNQICEYCGMNDALYFGYDEEQDREPVVCKECKIELS